MLSLSGQLAILGRSFEHGRALIVELNTNPTADVENMYGARAWTMDVARRSEYLPCCGSQGRSPREALST